MCLLVYLAKGQSSTVASIQIQTSSLDETDEVAAETSVALVELLLFGKYDIIVGPSGAPLFLHLMDETKAAFLEYGVSESPTFQQMSELHRVLNVATETGCAPSAEK